MRLRLLHRRRLLQHRLRRAPASSCASRGRSGTCWPIDAGRRRSARDVCKDQGAASCGQTGACDGFGGCAQVRGRDRLRRALVQRRPPQHGRHLRRHRHLPAAGRAGLLARTAAPRRLHDHCKTDADCASGHVCVNGSCGPKPNGQPAPPRSDCVSGFCVDGVCCDDRLRGRLPQLRAGVGAWARARRSPAGAADPRNVCVDQGASSCGTDGTCDGAGGASKYSRVPCARPRTAPATSTRRPSTATPRASASRPDAVACAPFACNGAHCFTPARTAPSCVAAATSASANSCGLKRNGALCSTGAECVSRLLRAGRLLRDGLHRLLPSCALPGIDGPLHRRRRRARPIPGPCAGPGRRQLRHQRPLRRRAPARSTRRGRRATARRCPAAARPSRRRQLRRRRTCVDARRDSCFPFICGAAACKATCTANADCAPPRLHRRLVRAEAAGRGLRRAAPSARPGICAQGVCCNRLRGQLHVVRADRQRRARARRSPPAARSRRPVRRLRRPRPAATTAFCDGAGALPAVRRGHAVRGAVLPAGTTTATLARTCDGAGTCKAASTQSCAPFACNGSACGAVCTATATAPPATSATAAPAEKRLGQFCAAGANATAATASTASAARPPAAATCASCNVAGQRGHLHRRRRRARRAARRLRGGPALRVRRHLQRRRRLPFGGGGTGCGAPSCTGRHGHRRRQLRRRRQPASRRTVSCAPYICGATPADGVRDQRDCVGGRHLPVGDLHQPGPNGTACTPAPLRQRPLHRRVCCGSSAAALQLVRGGRQARELRPHPQWRHRPGRPVPGDARLQLRDHRRLQRRRRLRHLRERHGLRGGVLRWQQRQHHSGGDLHERELQGRIDDVVRNLCLRRHRRGLQDQLRVQRRLQQEEHLRAGRRRHGRHLHLTALFATITRITS